jgi:hypothetical protein
MNGCLTNSGRDIAYRIKEKVVMSLDYHFLHFAEYRDVKKSFDNLPKDAFVLTNVDDKKRCCNVTKYSS